MVWLLNAYETIRQYMRPGIRHVLEFYSNRYRKCLSSVLGSRPFLLVRFFVSGVRDGR
jgi:hypothetical protein